VNIKSGPIASGISLCFFDDMPRSLLIFDLDGTLADSFPWFLRNVNDVADRFGFRRIADGDVESLRHAGSREILRRLEVRCGSCPASQGICGG